MSWWRKLLCGIGWHSLEEVHDMSAEEAGKRMAEAKSGFEVLGIMLAGALSKRWVCKHCSYETRT